MRGWMAAALVVSGIGSPAAAQTPAAKAAAPAPSAKPSDNYDDLVAKYLEEARRMTPAPDSWSWMSSLGLDLRARALNDLVTIRVVENISAQGTADSNLTKSSDAKAGLTGLFGIEKKLPSVVDPTSLLAGKSDSSFKGAGSTTRAGVLTAVMTARVAEVLPNGDLFVEGVREIEINGDRQIVVLTGVVRWSDIAADNVVLSTSIGQLRIRYFGRGLMKDNLKPGWLVRVLNKIF